MTLPDPGKQERMEEFLRKSLLGEEIINTQFHLFSAKSSTSDRVVNPRVLCANNVLLAKSSKYFLDLLSSDVHPSDPSLSDLTGDNDMPNNVQLNDYGYASDSDLDDEEEEEEPPIRIAETKVPKDRLRAVSAPTARISVVTQPKDDDQLSDDGSDSTSSDMFVMSPEHPSTDPPVLLNTDGLLSVASSETAIHEDSKDKMAANPNSPAVRLRSLGSRHVLVKDTAFQTWYTLLNYLYTGKYSFLPLSSAAPGGHSGASSTSARDEPECSAKSMYRLACKVGLDHLRDEAMAHIRNNLSENNILKELSCSLVSRHPELLEMELDALYTHIASPPVVTGFPALARRIALRELPHGADIIVGIHTRVLKERQSLPPTPRFAPEPVIVSPPRSPPVLVGVPAHAIQSPSLQGKEREQEPATSSLGEPLQRGFFGFQTASLPGPSGLEMPSAFSGETQVGSSFGSQEPSGWGVFGSSTVGVLETQVAREPNDCLVDDEQEVSVVKKKKVGGGGGDRFQMKKVRR